MLEKIILEKIIEKIIIVDNETGNTCFFCGGISTKKALYEDGANIIAVQCCDHEDCIELAKIMVKAKVREITRGQK